MAPLPIGATLDEAFRFGLRRWGAVLRFLWIPFLLVAVAGAAVGAATLDAEFLERTGKGAAPETFADILRTSPALAGLAYVAFAAFAMLLFSGGFASLFRLVALGEERPAFAQLRLDSPAAHVFLALALVMAINLALVVAFSLIGAAATGQGLGPALDALGQLYLIALQTAPGAPPPVEKVEALAPALAPLAAGWMLSLIPAIYINLRLAPLPAASAVAGRLMLGETWRAMRGRFGATFAIYLVFMGAMLLLTGVVQIGASALSLAFGLGAGQNGAVGAVAAILNFILRGALFWFQLFVMSVQYALPAIIWRRVSSAP